MGRRQGRVHNEVDMRMTRVLAAVLLLACSPFGQATNDPFPTPIAAEEGVIGVRFVEFASLPDIDGAAARMMLLVDEPGTGRLFVNDMRGPIYGVSYDGETVAEYLDINAAQWGVNVLSRGRERGFQSFAFHPQFGETGTPGFGKLYTWTDTSNTAPEPDFVPGGGDDAHDTVLLEWTARDPAATTYDGGPPRQMLRIEQPFGNHNGGHLAFNPLVTAGDADFGMLYVGVADGGSGGDPLGLAQNLGSVFGKILRIDPLGNDGANGQYGIPADNPFVGTAGALGEIWAYGLRNPQRFGWDPSTGNVYVADIGQNTVEELSPVSAGANLGWNLWEGSFAFVSRSGVSLADPRGDAAMTYPVAEYGQVDPLLQRQSAVTGVIVYRDDEIPQLAGRILFGDFASGEIFHVSADDPPDGGQAPIRRVLLDVGGELKTFLQVIQEKNVAQGKEPATRTDLRFGTGPNGQVFLLNKQDGTIRLLVAGS
jgi:glucose/arabinose dehydrogenase